MPTSVVIVTTIQYASTTDPSILNTDMSTSLPLQFIVDYRPLTLVQISENLAPSGSSFSPSHQSR